MVAKLVIEEGDLKGISLSLEDGEAWTIGRDPDECQLVIEDPLVSRKHFIIRRTPEGFLVENLSTTTPTLLNDEEINDQTHLLLNGDTLKVGREVLRFYEESSIQVLDQVLDNDLNDIAEFEDIDHAPDHEIDSAESGPQSIPKTQLTENQDDTHIQENTAEIVAQPDEIALPEDLPVNASEILLPETEDLPDERSLNQDTIFGEESLDANALAEIDFGVIETGRWLLKVIGGPNSGAEFYMQAGNSYVIGTDPNTCDIVFHDTSVSRQHARITVTPEDTLLIEDLKSRNGILINGNLIEHEQNLPPSLIVTLGTTSFVVYDREGEMHTIISPLLPSIVKVLQQDPSKTAPPADPVNIDLEAILESKTEEAPPPPPPIEAPEPPPKPPRQLGPYIILSAIIGLFVLAGIGTTLLFHDEPVIVQTQENANELIQESLKSFPSIRWTFNKSNGSLLLLGHVSTAAEKNRLIYNLGDLKFIKNLDDNGIIIDEGVLNEVNSLIANNPEWRGIRVYTSEAGQFILSGTLKTRKQAEQLSSYLSLNFPYLDLLKKQIVVEEDIIQQVQAWLQNIQLASVSAKMSGGEVILTGNFPPGKGDELNGIITKIKQISGVRMVLNQTQSQTAETGTIDLTDQYQVTGKSRLGNKFTVVINGRILSEGDDIDGMTIDRITSNQILLEKDKDKFRISY